MPVGLFGQLVSDKEGGTREEVLAVGKDTVVSANGSLAARPDGAVVMLMYVLVVTWPGIDISTAVGN